ncbi:MAG: hypothetical protein Q7T03_04270 [Deltaproteobacteria bacterium]|nr:hypothetical protein [Deltaproteobacteria bacterium]
MFYELFPVFLDVGCIPFSSFLFIIFFILCVMRLTICLMAISTKRISFKFGAIFKIEGVVWLYFLATTTFFHEKISTTFLLRTKVYIRSQRSIQTGKAKSSLPPKADPPLAEKSGEASCRSP